MVKNNKLHIIYNDEPKNVDYALSSSKRPKVFNNGKKMHLVMISFEENGKANKTVLGDNEQMETNILIPRSFQTKGDRFFLYGYQFFSKENRLGLATFK